MTENLDIWKEAWLGQTLKNNDMDEQIARLKSIENKARVHRYFIIGAYLIMVLYCAFNLHELENLYYQLALLFMTLGVGYKLWDLYRNKLIAPAQEITLDNTHYITKLRDKMRYGPRQLLIFQSLMILSINLSFLGLYQVEAYSGRIFWHLGSIAFLILMFTVKKRGIAKNRQAIEKLIADLS